MLHIIRSQVEFSNCLLATFQHPVITICVTIVHFYLFCFSYLAEIGYQAFSCPNQDVLLAFPSFSLPPSVIAVRHYNNLLIYQIFLLYGWITGAKSSCRNC